MWKKQPENVSGDNLACPKSGQGLPKNRKISGGI